MRGLLEIFSIFMAVPVLISGLILIQLKIVWEMISEWNKGR